ncbi:hypothetical protein QUV83_13290, partial [Cellulomonas cellasea]|nr:hypothetical protein [Cellulomonas cellasea]
MPRNASVVASGSAAVLLLGVASALAFSDTPAAPGPIGAPLVISDPQNAGLAPGLGGPVPGDGLPGVASDGDDDGDGDAEAGLVDPAPPGPAPASTAPGAVVPASSPVDSSTSVSSPEPAQDDSRSSRTSPDRSWWVRGTTEWWIPSPAPSPTS